MTAVEVVMRMMVTTWGEDDSGDYGGCRDEDNGDVVVVMRMMVVRTVEMRWRWSGL